MQEEYDETPELIQPEDLLPPSPFPLDAQRLGIDRYTGDGGALIGFAGALNPRKTSHKIVALLLFAVVVMPVALTVWRLIGQ